MQKTQIGFLNIEKTFKIIFAKYLDFINMFLKEITIKLFKYLNIKKYAISLKMNQQ